VIPGTPFQQSVAATLDLGPQRIFRTQAAGRGTTATRLVLADVTRQVTFRVRQSFYDVLLADSLRAIARERRDIFRGLLAADSVRWQSGDVPERNVTKSELELAGAEADLAGRTPRRTLPVSPSRPCSVAPHPIRRSRSRGPWRISRRSCPSTRLGRSP